MVFSEIAPVVASEKPKSVYKGAWPSNPPSP